MLHCINMDIILLFYLLVLSEKNGWDEKSLYFDKDSYKLEIILF